MEELDIYIRFAVIAVLLAIALRVLWMTGLTHRSAAAALFGLGVASYMLASSRTLFPLLGPLRYLIIAGSAGVPVFFWWFSGALFDDGFRLRPWHYLFCALFIGFGLFMAFAPSLASEQLNAAPLVLHHVIALGLAFAALFEALNNRAADLIESRRRMRLIIVLGSGAYILIVLSVELVFREARAPAWLESVNAAGILLLTLFLAPKFNRELFPALENQGQPEPAIAPADRLIVQKLLAAMQQDKLYREEGLTITALSERLAVQEYRLRRLINQHLGYRNFNAFLNHYRIGEARAQLSDIALARIPVLTIAMDLGYRSLSPFNKAFREITGLTPTEYRRAQLAANNPADSEKIAAIPESN